MWHKTVATSVSVCGKTHNKRQGEATGGGSTRTTQYCWPARITTSLCDVPPCLWASLENGGQSWFHLLCLAAEKHPCLCCLLRHTPLHLSLSAPQTPAISSSLYSRVCGAVKFNLTSPLAVFPLAQKAVEYKRTRPQSWKPYLYTQAC